MYHFFKTRRYFRKGDFRYVVLDALKERPMHGYEIIKVVGQRFSGFYAPSAGVVYPTLQMLEDLGYVRHVSEDSKKIYSITEDGEKFLEEKRGVLEGCVRRHEQFMSSGRLSLFKELKRLSRLLFISLPELTPEKVEEVAKVIEEARSRVSKIIHE